MLPLIRRDSMDGDLSESSHVRADSVQYRALSGTLRPREHEECRDTAEHELAEHDSH